MNEREQIAAWLEERARGIHEREQEAESKGARVGSSAAAVALSLVAGQIRNGAHADGDKHSDSDRLDWLERENGRIGWNGREWVAFRSGRSNLRETGSRTGTGKTLREAIDAVMRKARV